MNEINFAIPISATICHILKLETEVLRCKK